MNDVPVLPTQTSYYPAVLLGLAIGDALGMPFEQKRADDPELLAWDGSYQPCPRLGLKPGQFTDDTQMATALASTLALRDVYDPAAAALAYQAWYTSGDARGIGGTIERAMKRLLAGESPEHSGIYAVTDSLWIGNGTAMRIAPLGLVYSNWRRYDEMRSAVIADARITHDDVEAYAASWLVARAVANYFNHAYGRLPARSPAAHMETSLTALHQFCRAQDCDVSALQRRLERAHHLLALPDPPAHLPAEFDRGDAIGTVASALYYAARASSFVDGVRAAVRAGGDTDTRAAIVGALLGARFGRAGIPPELLDGIEDREKLVLFDEALTRASFRKEWLSE